MKKFQAHFDLSCKTESEFLDYFQEFESGSYNLKIEADAAMKVS